MKKITLLFALFIVSVFTVNAQFSENFDTEIPATWTVLNEDGGTFTWEYVTNYPQAGAGHARIHWEGAAHDDYLITPQFTVTTGTSDRASFYAGIDGTFWTETFEVRVSTTGNSAADFTDLIASETATTNANAADYTLYSYDLSAYNGQAIYIAIRATDTDRFYLAVDEFSVDTPPACPEPVTLAAANITSSSADLSWAQGGSEMDWEYALLLDTDPAPITGIATMATTFNATSLPDNTNHIFYVRANCGGAGFSNWTSIAFITLSLPPANDECDNVITLTVNSDFACGVVTSGTTAGATASAQADDVSGTPNTDVWFNFTATAASHRVELQNVVNQGGGTSTSTDMGMGVYDATGGCLGLVFVDTSDPNVLDLSGLTIGVNYYVRVYGWSTLIQNNNFDICVGTPPSCVDPTGLNTSNFAETSADLGWTENGLSTAWNIEWGAVPFTQGSGTVESGVTTNPFNLTGLSGTTDYEFYVQSVCGGMTTSAWVGPFAFSTLSPAPANNDCASPTILTPGAVFITNPIAGQTQLGATDSGEMPLPSCSVYDPADASGNGGDIWYAVTVPADGNLIIETQGDPVANGGDTGMSVYSGSCGALTEIDCDDDLSSDGNYSLITIADITLANQTVLIRVFEFSGNDVLSFQISAYSATLSVGDSEFSGFKYFPNPVTNELTLEAQNNIQNVIVYNMLGQEVLRLSPNAIESKLDMNGLSDGAYFVKVTINNSTETIRVIKN